MHAFRRVALGLAIAAQAGALSATDIDFPIPNPALHPSEGVWWSSTEPGTGMAFNVDDEGRWFAAIYLYDAHGDPTFLTMQGPSLTYTGLYPTQTTPWAIAASPLIESRNGQCLGCPWQAAETSVTDKDAEIRFHGRNSAELLVGDWSLRLTPLTVPASPSGEPVIPPFNKLYLFSGRADPSGSHHVAVVRLRGQFGIGGYTSARIECVDCRTVDSNGEPDATVDAALKSSLESMAVFCGFPRCNLWLEANGAHSSPLFVDKQRQVFSAIDTRPMQSGAGNVIKLELLDDDWGM